MMTALKATCNMYRDPLLYLITVAHTQYDINTGSAKILV